MLVSIKNGHSRPQDVRPPVRPSQPQHPPSLQLPVAPPSNEHPPSSLIIAHDRQRPSLHVNLPGYAPLRMHAQVLRTVPPHAHSRALSPLLCAAPTVNCTAHVHLPPHTLLASRARCRRRSVPSLRTLSSPRVRHPL
ncbi:uncharacterized protein ARMOST_15667 [Armillaria ostoyae]|uniref:Uncharacterized protein n=1 Tax=Armillaria ostoyae TaxID=47428 RepID=A0A284RU01_ARMOS|nr:uncharacterized protein ARMOST_15667 [Armillaria ostoyae]